jgi:acyl-CoA synthetase (AMP-forming)/AMP-acid ligase II
MRRAGIGPKQSVGIVESSPFEFVVAYFATQLVEAVPVPLNPHIGAKTIGEILRQAPFAASFCPRDYGHKLPNPLKVFEGPAAATDLYFPDIDQPADLFFYSKRDGELVGVQRSHKTQVSVARMMSRFIGNRSTDREILPVPLSHPFGLSRLLSILLSGGAAILCDGVSRPDHLFELMSRWRATGLSMLAPSWSLLEKLSADRLGQFARQLRYVEFGGGRLTIEQKLHLLQLLPKSRLCSSYGWPEEPHATYLSFRDSLQRVESEGRAAPGVQISVRDGSGRALPAGRSGEIWFRLAGEWKPTGEMGRLDLQGYLYRESFAPGMICVGGWQVSAREVEQVLLSHPAISKAEVEGAADPIMGEVVTARLGGSRLSPDQLFSHVRKYLEPHKVPVRVRWVLS